MKTIFRKNSIFIEADLTIIQDVLIQYRNICEWEKDVVMFKELHVSNDKKTIAHWDIEHDIDYTFNLTDKSDKVLLTLQAVDLSGDTDIEGGVESIQQYMDTVLIRIKDLSERLQYDIQRAENTTFCIYQKGDSRACSFT